MSELLFVVEGQTEDEFVRDVLKPHFMDRYDVLCRASIVGRGNKSRGGGYFKTWSKDLKNHTNNRNPNLVAWTTMFDLYGLPKDFPDYARLAAISDTAARCREAEEILASVVSDLCHASGDPRFVPYVQRHEFEALVLASLPSLTELVEKDALPAVESLARAVGTTSPEEINDGRETSPSQRLKKIPGYDKVLWGSTVTMNTGLRQIRAACPRFDEWLSELESRL